MTCATHCTRTTNATTFRAPHPPTAAYPNRDLPQLTAGQLIQERPTTRTRTKHCYPRRSPPRPHRARTRRSALPSRKHYLAQHGSDTIRHTTSFLSPTLPHLRSCQTQQGQQTNLVKTTTSPTTATPRRQTFTYANHHQNRSLNAQEQEEDTCWGIGECISYGKFRRVQTIPQLPRHKKQVHVQLPNQDMRRRLILVLPSTGTPILHNTRNQAAGTTTRPSAPPKPTHSTTTISAATKAPPHTNNGRTQWNATSKPYSPTSRPHSTDRTFSARTYGTTHCPTGPDYTTLYHTPSPSPRQLVS